MQAKASASNILKNCQCHLYKASYTPVGALRDILCFPVADPRGSLAACGSCSCSPRGLWDPFDINLPFLEPTEIETWL